MNVLIVYAHPNPQSFNRSILDTVDAAFKKRGDTVRIRDLYADNFNPVLDEAQLELQTQGDVPTDIVQYQQDVEWADTIVIIYPLWWFDRPAILKGWFDRVFTNGFAFSFDDGEIKGLLTGKRAIVIVTTGGTKEDFGKNADQLTRNTTEGTLAFCGIHDIVDRVFYSVPIVEDGVRQEMLSELKSFIQKF